MCSIVGSFKKDNLIELINLNAYRGQHAHSISYYDIVSGQITVERGEGKIDTSKIKEQPLVYIIAHMQAPTSDKSVTNIHPAQYEGRCLWHNGILKQDYIKQLKEQLKEVCEWDTFLILKSITEDRESLNFLDGSFSCLLYDHEKLYLFRNEISPMYVDSNLNMSSVKFPNAESTLPNTMYHVDFNIQSLFAVKTFVTVGNPYYFQE
jgi:glutamine phosphoribosylpyrophosphate amidotransferase